MTQIDTLNQILKGWGYSDQIPEKGNENVLVNSNSEITSITFTNKNLKGDIPSSISIFTSLETLILNFNQLTGNIQSIDTLTNLQTLEINNNQLSGNIPLLNTLTNLQSLLINNNKLSGNIPSFDTLTNLNTIEINSNLLSGNIPSFDTLTNLQTLEIKYNQLSGNIPSFDTLTNLQTLEISNNQLSGNIPSFDTLTNLQTLEISNNQLSGNIPSFDTLTNLQTLEISNNQLSGNIPSFDTLTNLQTLEISNNNISSLSSNIYNLPNLTTVDLSNNNIIDDIEVFTSTKLTSLNLSNNCMTLKGGIALEYKGKSYNFNFKGNCIDSTITDIDIGNNNCLECSNCGSACIYDINIPDWTNWYITDELPMTQTVILDTSIFTKEDDIYVIETNNPSVFEYIKEPTFTSILNISPNKGEISGTIKASVDTTTMPDFISSLYIYISNNDNLYNSKATLNIEEKSTKLEIDITNIKNDLAILYDNITYTDDDQYAYLFIKVDIPNQPAYSFFSNSVNLPKNNIVPLKSVSYSNFWPYSFNYIYDETTKSYTKGEPEPISTGPLEIFEGEITDDNQGYLLYNNINPLPKTLTDDNYNTDPKGLFTKDSYLAISKAENSIYNSDNESIIISFSGNIQSKSDDNFNNPFSDSFNGNVIPMTFDKGSSNVFLDMAAWGYAKEGVSGKINILNGENSNIENIIYTNPTQINMNIRDVNNSKGDLNINNSSTQGISTFKNYIGEGLSLVEFNIPENPVLTTVTANITGSFSKIYFAGIEETQSLICTRNSDDSYTSLGSINELNNILYRLYQSNKVNITPEEGSYLNSISNTDVILKNMTLIKDGIRQKKPGDFYLIQTDISIPTFDTIPINLIDQNKSKIVISNIIFKVFDSVAGNGGNMACIYIDKENKGPTINNVVAISGGGGGSGIYSDSKINADTAIFKGNDGLGLYKKNVIEEINDFNKNMNNMNGGSIACYKNTTPYQINTSCLGGCIHTFKSEIKNANKYYTVNPNTINNGFYPNTKNDDTIIPPYTNGFSFISVKSNIVNFNGDTYNVDSKGLSINYSISKIGDGGSADTKGQEYGPTSEGWGAKDNTIKFNNNQSIDNWNSNYTVLYGRGGGGGGGFGGGSAGSYFYFENNTSPIQKLSNVPPGGGGGGNSFYNTEIYENGLSYGIDNTTLNNNITNSTNKSIPSLLPQLLHLANPKSINNKTIDDYNKGDNTSYMYVFTGAKSDN